MDNQHFAEGYLNHPQRVEWGENPEVTNLLEGPRYWASFFDEQVTRYLQGEEPSDTKQLHNQILDYHRWSTEHLDKTISKMTNIALQDRDEFRHINELNFFLMTESTHNLWQKVICEQNYNFSPKFLTDVQTVLAMEAAKLLRQKKQVINTYGERSEFVSVINGQLTEIDTLEVMIEMMKDEAKATGKTSLIALAAPPRFESSRTRAINADLLLIDTDLKHSRGVQAKTATSLDLPKTLAYDNDRITIIDGVTDLGNSTGSYQRNERGAQRLVMKPLPGLISMDHLQRISIKDVPHGQTGYFGRDLMHAKSIARELSGTRKSYIAQATAHVSSKLLSDLYKEPKEPKQAS